MAKILFHIAQDYYWPSMEPIYKEFKKDKKHTLHLHVGTNPQRFLFLFLISQRAKLEKKYIEQNYQITRSPNAYDAVFCGAPVKKPERFGNALLCNVDHGPGIKTLRYRHFLEQPNVRYICFIEGPYREEKFKKYNLDKIEEIYNVGLPKLDIFFNNTYNRESLMAKYKLDPNKKNVLYAPSYKPTSIFDIGRQIVQLSDKYNIIVKLHPYSWTGKYAPHAQHRFFERLEKEFPQFLLVPQSAHNIMPFIFIADTMISDGSSVINEFLALERCGIIYNLIDDRLKHHDGQPLLEDKSSEWLKESFIHIQSPDQVGKAIEEAIFPSHERKKNIRKDKEYIFSYTDGKSALRVKEKVIELINNR
jgi:CDP-glycerol glycerophosphotransferase (TagB/SpsB family)